MTTIDDIIASLEQATARASEQPTAAEDPEPTPEAAPEPEPEPEPKKVVELPKSIKLRKPPDLLLKNGLLLTVNIRSWGNSATVPEELLKSDAQKGMLTGKKKKLDSPEWQAINEFDAETRSTIYRRSVKSIFRPGTYVISREGVERMENWLSERVAERAVLIDNFIAAYQDEVNEAPEKLGSLYNPLDYSPASTVKQSYFMDWYYSGFESLATAPSMLQGISRDIFERQKEKAAKRMESITMAISQVVRSEFKTLVDRMADNLQLTDKSGKTKKFSSSIMPQLREFIQEFRLRNVAEDDDLDALVSRAEMLLDGVDIKDVRSDNEFRDNLRAKFESVKTKLDTMVIDAPLRSINIDGDV